MPEGQATTSSKIPLLPNVTADSWKRLMASRPAGMTTGEWNTVCLVIAETSAGRMVPSSRIKAAEALAKKGGLSDKQKKYLSDAEDSALENESTATGRDRISKQAPLSFVSPSQATKPAPAAAPAPQKVAAATAPASAAPVRPKTFATQATDSEVPGSRVVRSPPPQAPQSKTPQAVASNNPGITVTHRPIPVSEREGPGTAAAAQYQKEQAANRAPVVVAAATATAATAVAATAATTSAATATPTPSIKYPEGLSATEKTAYKHLLTAVRAGTARKSYTYGKLNWGYEVASRASDDQAKIAIAADMRKIRRFAPGPGRYGVSDKEYKNYSMVQAALGNADETDKLTPAALKMAYGTAKKYGHVTTMDVIAEHMPALANEAKPAVAAAAVAAPPVAAAAGSFAAKKASTDLGPPPEGIPAEYWKTAPPRPGNVSLSDWRTYLTVNYHLTQNGPVPSNDDLLTAAKIASSRGDKKSVQIYKTIAKGNLASVPELAAARGLALHAKIPRKKTADLLGDRLILAASHSGSVDDLKVAEATAREMDKLQTAGAIRRRIAVAAGAGAAAATVATAAAVAAPKTAPKAPQAAPVATPPASPAVVATVPNTPPAKTVAAQAQNVGVPAPVVAKIIIEARNDNPQARQIVEQGANVAQAAARGDGGAREQIATWQSELPRALPRSKLWLEWQLRMRSRRLRRLGRQEVRHRLRLNRMTMVVDQNQEAPPNPPPHAVASVKTTPSPAMVTAAAAGAGVAAGAVAATVLAAKKGDKNAQADMHEGANLATDLENGDPAAHQHLANLQTAAKGGNKAAEGKLVGVAAAVATQKAISASSVEPMEASIAGPSEGGGGGVAAAIAGVALGAIMIVTMAGSKKPRSGK